MTEVDGRIKGGKTTLVMAMVAAVLNERRFLGKPTTWAPVFFLTEQGPASFRETLRRGGLLDRDDLHVLHWVDVRAVPWPELVERVRARAREVGAGLLVVDTLSQWAGLRGDAENAAGAALEAVGPLQATAADGLAVLVLRHERKSGGEVGDSARGSSAFGGAVDIVVQIRRPEGNSRPTLRTLTALSRFDETPVELVVELGEDGEYIAHGDGAAVAHAEALSAVRTHAPATEGTAVTEKDLLATAGVKRTLGQTAIRELLAAGELAKTGAGKRGDPYRYWRPSPAEKRSALPRDEVAAESNGDGTDLSPSFLPEHPLVVAETNGHQLEGMGKGSAATPPLQEAETNERDPVLAETLASLLTLSPDGLAAYRDELANADPDDPHLVHDWAALARAETILAGLAEGVAS